MKYELTFKGDCQYYWNLKQALTSAKRLATRFKTTVILREVPSGEVIFDSRQK